MADGDTTITEAPFESTPTVAERPDNVPEKFWDADAGSVRTEDLLKSYGELESLQSTPTTTEVPEGIPKIETAPTPEISTETLEMTPEVMSDFTERYRAQDKELTVSDYKELQDTYGYSKTMVDEHVAGLIARGDSFAASLYADSGVKDAAEFGLVLEWAATNLSEAEIDTFNTASAAMNTELAMGLAQGMVARYKNDNSTSADTVLRGDSSGSPVGDLFLNFHDLATAMQDPRFTQGFGHDPVYHKEVVLKARRSKANLKPVDNKRMRM